MKFKTIIIIFLTCLLLGCSPSTLPEGFTIICSPSGKIYSLRHKSFADGISANEWGSKVEAISYANYWNELEVDKSKWQDCE